MRSNLILAKRNPLVLIEYFRVQCSLFFFFFFITVKPTVLQRAKQVNIEKIANKESHLSSERGKEERREVRKSQKKLGVSALFPALALIPVSFAAFLLPFSLCFSCLQGAFCYIFRIVYPLVSDTLYQGLKIHGIFRS